LNHFTKPKFNKSLNVPELQIGATPERHATLANASRFNDTALVIATRRDNIPSLGSGLALPRDFLCRASWTWTFLTFFDAPICKASAADETMFAHFEAIFRRLWA